MQQKPSNRNLRQVKLSAEFVTRISNIGSLGLDQVQSSTCLSFLPHCVCLNQSRTISLRKHSWKKINGFNFFYYSKKGEKNKHQISSIRPRGFFPRTLAFVIRSVSMLCWPHQSSLIYLWSIWGKLVRKYLFFFPSSSKKNKQEKNILDIKLINLHMFFRL